MGAPGSLDTGDHGERTDIHIRTRSERRGRPKLWGRDANTYTRNMTFTLQ